MSDDPRRGPVAAALAEAHDRPASYPTMEAYWAAMTEVALAAADAVEASSEDRLREALERIRDDDAGYVAAGEWAAFGGWALERARVALAGSVSDKENRRCPWEDCPHGENCVHAVPRSVSDKDQEPGEFSRVDERTLEAMDRLREEGSPALPAKPLLFRSASDNPKEDR